MATAVIGQLLEFNPETDSLTAYVERVKLFIEANGIEDARKVPVLLSVIGGKTYDLLRNLLSPTDPKDKTFDELVEALKGHYEPKPLVIAERFHFHKRNQAAGESVAQFIAELRRLARHCEFKTFLEEALRDRFVCGLGSKAIQNSLLNKELTLQKAVDLATGMEAAAKEVTELQATSTANAANAGTAKKDVLKVTINCYRCGKSNHKPINCPVKGLRCHNCGKVGHIKRACKQAKRNSSVQSSDKKRTHRVKTVLEATEADTESEEDMHYLKYMAAKPTGPIKVDVLLDSKPVSMELDTGAPVSLMSRKMLDDLFPGYTLQPCSLPMQTYLGEPITVAGQMQVEVRYGEQKETLPLVVVEGRGPSLFGRQWLTKIRLNWQSINNVRSHPGLQDILDRHQEVFTSELGTLKGYKAQISVDPNATPRFCKARSVPYAMYGKVDEELQRLEKDGIIEAVQFADWAAPIVSVLKSDGKSVRICGDFKLTVNQAPKLDRYPIPKIEDLLAKLAGGKLFTKLDMSQAYQQLLLDEESKKFVVINTHCGLYRFNRLPFGVASAPGIFQRVMESLLSGIPGVVVYIDDILVTGKTEGAHLAALEEVLKRLSNAGLRLKRTKCIFLAPSVDYLGYRVDAQGTHPMAEKVKAIQEAPRPTNVSELKSYIGLLTYYSRFLPNLSTTLAPLYKLLKHSVKWQWSDEQEKSFKESKQSLLSSQLLVHFDPSLNIRLACDASAYGIGAVLSHEMPDGSEKPIGFVSRTLSDAEKKYSQIEKEGLACVFGVKRFHAYLFGHHFTLQTDHRPLMSLFNESKPIPAQASNRIQRWALTLSSYQYTIACRTTQQHANADAMSRLPLPEMPQKTVVPPEFVLMVQKLDEAPITAAQIAAWTQRDPLLSEVLQYLQNGWPASANAELKPYWTKRTELTSHAGCILWAGRVIVPPPGRTQVLLDLHSGHPGVTKMKALARSLVWWPGLDSELEKMVKECSQCQQCRPTPAVAPLHPWQWPTRPWSRLHIDYAGPTEGKMFLIVIDAHSKWIEVFPMTSATALTTVQHLRQLFSRFGIPDSIVSDNGSQFVAKEFQEFCKSNGIQHIRVAPYHPSSNGLAERAVQVFKQGMKKVSSGTIWDRISKFLFQYRITPHTTTGLPPCEMLMGRKLRSRLDLLKPDVQARVISKQAKQKSNRDKHCKPRTFVEGERVYAKNFGQGNRWLPGLIVSSKGPVSFEIELQNGKKCHRHQDHLRHRAATDSAAEHQSEENTLVVDGDDDLYDVESNPEPERVENNSPEPEASGGESRRYPSRIHRPPNRYGL